MGEAQVLGALELDDAYELLHVLASGPSGRTELVRMGGSDMLVRKRVPLELANVGAWCALMDVSDGLLPEVVSLYRLPDELVVVCGWVEGTTLAEVVDKAGRLGPARAVAVLADVCHAAGVLHAHGIVHRDIVPNNVVIDPAGRAHLIDLGIARVHADGETADTHPLGTWGFAAPEQFGFTQTDARSDVYSLGRLLAFMLAGETPGTAAPTAAMADDADIPRPLVSVIACACAFEPSARYQTAAELAADAEAAVAEVAARSQSGRESRGQAGVVASLAGGTTTADAHVDGAGRVNAPAHVGEGAQRARNAAPDAAPSARGPKRVRVIGMLAVVLVAVAVVALLAVRGATRTDVARTVPDASADANTVPDGTGATGTDAGASSQGDKSGTAATSAPIAPGELVIAESAYIVSDGYVHYAVALENTSGERAVTTATIRLVGTDANGTVTFSDEWVVGATQPKATSYWAGMAGSGRVGAADVVDISVTTDADGWVVADAGAADGPYEFSDVTLGTDQLGMSHVTGRLTLTDATNPAGAGSVATPMLVCVLRGADGRMLGGFDGFIWSELAVGAPTAFDVSASFDLPAGVQVEMHANPWF